MITNINEFKNSINENNANLEIGKIYKIYDKLKNGAIIYSQAKFDGDDENGYKFTIINRNPAESISLNNIDNYVFSQTMQYIPKKK